MERRSLLPFSRISLSWKDGVLLFAGVVLVAQFAFAHLVEEPYPAIVYPAFGNITDGGESGFVVTRAEVAVRLEDATTVEVDPASLFRPIPDEFANALMRTMRLKGGEDPDRVRIPLGAYVYEIERVPKNDERAEKQFLEWLERRALLTTGSKPVAVNLVYRRYTIFPTADSFRAEATEVERITFEFDGDLDR